MNPTAPADEPAEPGATITVSAIIPVVGDRSELGALVTSLRQLPGPPDEIIVVDGAASSACRTLAGRLGCVYVRTRAGRGHQLHAGALRASSQVLWFIHADTTLPGNPVSEIRRSFAGGAVGGYFRFSFAGRNTWFRRALAGLINWRTRFGIPYGDQALFVSRTAYDRSGGFSDMPLFEEVPLVRALRRQGSLARLETPVGVSTRRWEKDGWFRRSMTNRLLALAYMAGVSPDRLVRGYRPMTDPDVDEIVARER